MSHWLAWFVLIAKREWIQSKRSFWMNLSRIGLVCLWATNSLVAQEKSIEEPGGQPPGKYWSELSAVLANLEAWETGDFLVREEFFFDSVKVDEGSTRGGMLNSRAFVRILFDHPRQKIAVYRIKSSEAINFNLPEKDTFRESTFVGATFDGTSRRLQLNSSTERFDVVLNQDQADKIFRRGVFPDYRTLWCYGLRFESQDIQTLRARLSHLFRTDEKATSTYEGNLHRIQYQRPFGNEVPSLPGEKFVVFDLELSQESLMPTFYGEKVTNKVRDIMNEEIRSTWISQNQIYVPAQVCVSKPTGVDIAGGTCYGVAEANFTFHIFSINQAQMPDQYFDGSLLGSSELIAAQCDPVKNQAGRLLKSPDTADKQADR